MVLVNLRKEVVNELLEKSEFVKVKGSLFKMEF